MADSFTAIVQVTGDKGGANVASKQKSKTVAISGTHISQKTVALTTSYVTIDLDGVTDPPTVVMITNNDSTNTVRIADDAVPTTIYMEISPGRSAIWEPQQAGKLFLATNNGTATIEQILIDH